MRVTSLQWIKVAVLGVFLAAVCFAGEQKPGRAEVALEAASKKEMVDGDLKGAIESYQKIVVQFGPTDRPAVAKALVRMGQCYEKLGSAEARKAYERAVREFSDQKETVATAQARLAALTSGQRPGLAYRRLWAGLKVDTTGTVSPDGRYLSWVNWDTGDLYLHDFATGSDRRLTNKGTWEQSEAFASNSSISRDGKQIAYGWYDEKGKVALCVGSLQPSGLLQPRRLFASEEVGFMGPLEWSPDGKWIALVTAASIHESRAKGQVVLISTRDGSPRILRPYSRHLPRRPSFSPDGKYLGFEVGEAGSSAPDVVVFPIDGGSETKAVVNPGQDFMMGWSPDGKWLLFASDRTGAIALWALPVLGGKPAGPAELLRQDIADWSLGLTSAGALHVGSRLRTRDIQMASLDFSSGKLMAAPVKPAQSFVGSNRHPDWSPDGKQLVFVSERNLGGGGLVLVIRSVETGQVRELRPANLSKFNWPRWEPGGRSLICEGVDLAGRQGVYRINTDTAESSPVAVSSEGLASWFPEPSADGKKVYYSRRPKDGEEVVLIEHDLAAGAEREVFRHRSLGRFCLLRDNRQLAVLVADVEAAAVLLVPIAGGQNRELIRLARPSVGVRLGGLTATPDGRHLLIKEMIDDGKDRFLLMPVTGGEPRILDAAALRYPALNAPGFPPRFVTHHGFRVHPDGKQIVYMTEEAKEEVWVLENFLPAS